MVIARAGSGTRETFTVRRIVRGEGVERKFPLHSPRITKIEVKRSGVTRRAKLYYFANGPARPCAENATAAAKNRARQRAPIFHEPAATCCRLLNRLFPQKTLGQRGEAAAERYLRRRGCKVLARGDRFGPGELDLVVLDRRTIVFVEVKTGESAAAGHPAEAVDDFKQRRLTSLAVTFLKRHRLLEYPARFDVVAVTWPAASGVPRSSISRTPLRRWGNGSFFRNSRLHCAASR